jgi:hypothetical protein
MIAIASASASQRSLGRAEPELRDEVTVALGNRDMDLERRIERTPEPLLDP